MDDKNLKSEIRKCRKFARKGAKLSREQLKKLSITLNEAKTNIDHFSRNAKHPCSDSWECSGNYDMSTWHNE